MNWSTPLELTIAANSVPFTLATETGVCILKSLFLPSFFILFSIVPWKMSIVRELRVSIKLKIVFSRTFKIDLSSKYITAAKLSSPILS